MVSGGARANGVQKEEVEQLMDSRETKASSHVLLPKISL